MALDRPHILISPEIRRLAFKPRTAGGGGKTFPPVAQRAAQAKRVLGELRRVIEAGEGHPFASDLVPLTVRASEDHGVVDTIPAPRRNEVLSSVGHRRAQRINVALDPDTYDKFEVAADNYVAWPESGRRPNFFNFFEALPVLDQTRVDDLWASPLPLPKGDREAAWEVWVQPIAERRFREAIEEMGLSSPPRGLEFDDIRILGLTATRTDFDRLVASASIAQLRPASSLNARLLQLSPAIQAIAVQGAARRVVAPPPDAPAVCLLDTGVNDAHPLLAPACRFKGVVGGAYAADDWDGHGTSMAGVALYETLPDLVAGGSTQLSIALESVAVEGPLGAIPSRVLPAQRLRQAVDMVEQTRGGTRTYCFAMNAEQEADDGSPSSLSSELDALAFDVAQPRLFCVAAGNLTLGPPRDGDYQSLNEITGILSPAQAWNSLTVAACTDLDAAPHTHSTVAPSGDLSPWSRTAVNWEARNRPPSKPDVVFEGGNQMVDRVSRAVGPHRDLSLLTTSRDLADPLTLTGMTSAATAAVSGLCARLQQAYPRYWPETVRGLVAHSSEHTPAMQARARALVGGRPDRGAYQAALLKRYGYGRVDPLRTMQNAEDALTLVVQDTLTPLRLNDEGKASVLGYMKFHALPWPIETLEQLGPEVPAELRVTLSYFIQPNPGVAIKGDMDLYPSHGLDFDLKRPDENDDEAIERINAAFEGGRAARIAPPPHDWAFGAFRGRGGLKHDRIETTAAELARMGGVSVYPRQKGWWSEGRSHVDEQVRYALIVTIRTPGQDIYTEIASAIATPV